MSRNVTHKFTRANVDYCQDFLNYMSNVDPFRLKFFDESGVSLYDCNKRYGHSPVNSGCVELGRHLKSPNITLNFLAGLEGVLYANTLDGASNMLEFLTFFHKATEATQINGNPVFMAGDILVLDNCATQAVLLWGSGWIQWVSMSCTCQHIHPNSIPLNLHLTS